MLDVWVGGDEPLIVLASLAPRYLGQGQAVAPFDDELWVILRPWLVVKFIPWVVGLLVGGGAIAASVAQLLFSRGTLAPGSPLRPRTVAMGAHTLVVHLRVGARIGPAWSGCPVPRSSSARGRCGLVFFASISLPSRRC